MPNVIDWPFGFGIAVVACLKECRQPIQPKNKVKKQEEKIEKEIEMKFTVNKNIAEK